MAETRHILLPRHGLRFDQPLGDAEVESLFAPHLPRGAKPARVISRAKERGPHLVEVHDVAAAKARAQRGDVRVVPVVHYRPAWVDRTPKVAEPGAAQSQVTIHVASAADGTPVASAQVAAVANLTTGQGVGGVTDANGNCTLTLSDPAQVYAAFYVTPRSSFWSYLAENVTLTNGMSVKLLPVSNGFEDALRYFYGLVANDAGAGVRVGVVDSGIGPHPDITLAGGRNCVEGEDPQDYGDSGMGHGTHVGGIIGARGTPPAGMRGVAPGCSLYSYRVYAKNSGTSTNFSIMTAIDQALTDGCDLVNLSLAIDGSDEGVSEAIADARNRGAVVLAASGNTTFGPRQPVSYPASDPLSLAIAAMGREATFPPDTLEVAETDTPHGTDPKNFVARFSNVGAQIAFTGPGVGIISTFPGGYAVLDGTSMACPAVCARATTLLAKDAKVLAMPRDRARSDAIAALLTSGAKLLGFGAEYEGHGMP